MIQTKTTHQDHNKSKVPTAGIKLVQQTIGLAYNLSAEHILHYKLIPSEEAKVWGISQDTGQIVAWLKEHKTTAKAQSELQALQNWGQQLHHGNCPQVLAHSESYLLLSHCAGQTQYTLTPQNLRQVAQFLSELHHLSWVDQDSLTLSKALKQRSLSLLKQEKDLQHALKTQVDSTYSKSFIELIKILREPVPLSTHPQLNQRCPCHRDIRLEHLLFHQAQPKQVLTSGLSVIDWGQSRQDHWSSDWTKLYFESKQAPRLWQSYWQERSLSIKLSSEEKRYLPQMLRWALALHTLNTLRWAYLHQQSLLKQANQSQIQSKSKDLLSLQVWKRALDELAQMNNFMSSRFTL